MIGLLKAGEEEALFSKALATIHVDVPVTFALPEHTWRETIDLERVLSLFTEFGFRTLGNRVRELLGRTAELAPEEAIVEEAIDAERLVALMLQKHSFLSDYARHISILSTKQLNFHFAPFLKTCPLTAFSSIHTTSKSCQVPSM
jgi:hypothetical protein